MVEPKRENKHSPKIEQFHVFLCGYFKNRKMKYNYLNNNKLIKMKMIHQDFNPLQKQMRTQGSCATKRLFLLAFLAALFGASGGVAAQTWHISSPTDTKPNHIKDLSSSFFEHSSKKIFFITKECVLLRKIKNYLYGALS